MGKRLRVTDAGQNGCGGGNTGFERRTRFGDKTTLHLAPAALLQTAVDDPDVSGQTDTDGTERRLRACTQPA